MNIIPAKLNPGDTIRIIAPASSLGIISQDNKNIANQHLKELGFKIEFSKHVEEIDEFSSSSIKSRVDDLHDAFRDPQVKAIFAVIGGFNVNQLLRYIDWDIIRKNPKIFIGYSDITALQNAILAKTNLITYSGPVYSTFGQKLYFDYTLEYFKKCLMSDAQCEIKPSDDWSDDKWYLNQDDRVLIPNQGFWLIAEGQAEGIIVGGNLCTLNLLQGTEFFPSLDDSILFLEEDENPTYNQFDRDFESLLSTPSAKNIKGIVFGRFQKGSEMNEEKIKRLIDMRPYLKNVPVIANVDFGHTSPIITFPIGGKAKLEVKKDNAQIIITKH
jgi:muramoyltetrapeptide carboxypeptidase LdcA involved in peptidoglycan recycling